MLNYRTVAIIKREVKAQLLSKTFIIMTLMMPLLFIGIGAIQFGLMNYDDDSQTHLIIVDEGLGILQTLEQKFAQKEYVQSGQFSIEYRLMDRNAFDEYLAANRDDLLEGAISGIVWIPTTAAQDKQLEYHSVNPKNASLTSRVGRTVNSALIERYFQNRDISDGDLLYARRGVDVTSYRVSEDKGSEEEGHGTMIVAMIFTFLLYLSLILNGTMLMRAVTEEKNNRVVEVLLSSVNTSELMTGKIVGSSITAIAQMAIWLLPALALSLTSTYSLPLPIDMSALNINVSLPLLLYFFANFCIGLLTFLGLFAAFGSMFNNEQEAQQGIWPIMLLIVVPFFITFSMVTNPANKLAEIASLIPFASIMIMPARMALVDTPVWQIALSLAVNIGVLILITKLGGKIYRIGVLSTGTKATLPDVIKWLKYKY